MFLVWFLARSPAGVLTLKPHDHAKKIQSVPQRQNDTSQRSVA